MISKPNTAPLTTRSICLGFDIAVARLIAFSNLISVYPLSFNSSALVRKASQNWSLAFLISFFLLEPNNLFTTSLSSLGSLSTIFLLKDFCRRVRNLPFMLLPGTMGCWVRASRMTTESTEPIAENRLDPPICIPVTTSKLAFIKSFPYICIPSFNCHHSTYDRQPLPP